MKIIDRLFHINPSDAVPENDDYVAYRIGLKWSTVGALTILGGLVLEATMGTELGVDIAAAGSPITFIGGMATALGLTGLEPQ